MLRVCAQGQLSLMWMHCLHHNGSLSRCEDGGILSLLGSEIRTKQSKLRPTKAVAAAKAGGGKPKRSQKRGWINCR
eukprot:6243759-Amphidinium_carterae.1